MLITPNKLTALRIIVIPVIVAIYLIGGKYCQYLCTGLFIIAAITDWLDGYLARKLNMQSQLGAFLDPVADKLIVTTLVVLLVSDSGLMTQLQSPILFSIASMIIVGREITISALREWMAELGKRASVAVSYVGKIKTTLQMIAIGMLLYVKDLFGLPVLLIGELFFYVAAALTLWSMVVYLLAAKRVFEKS